VGAWYTIGLFVGIGVALGVAATGTISRRLAGLGIAIATAVAIGLLVRHWPEAVAGALGAACGAAGVVLLVAGSLRRGGTRGGTAVLLLGGALVLAALALVPVVGYLEAVAALVVAVRLRRRSPDRHAGLRTLARD
jgi:hypothetical protein